MKQNIVACTGHRPAKTGGYSDEAHDRLTRLAENCLSRLEPKLVIVGGALGWDQACAQACANLKIPFQVYYPFRNYDARWPQASRDKADQIHRHAELCVYVTEGYPDYHPGLLHARNHAMVNASELVLALYNGTSGGTQKCVDYARSRGRVILNCWDRYERGDF